MKKIYQKVLGWMAKRVLNKYQPKVIAITGSVGKTTTKEAVSHLLKDFFSIRKTEKNLNTEIGLPMTILGVKNYQFKLLGAVESLFNFLSLIFFKKKYPEILILEMGADKKGDIKYLCNLANPLVGILTEIGLSHLAKFKSVEVLAREKEYLIKNLPSAGLAVVNFDNERCRLAAEKISANICGYGFDLTATMRASDLIFDFERDNFNQEILDSGASFKVNYEGKIVPVRIDQTISKGSVYACLAAFSVGSYFGLNLVQMAEKMRSFKSLSNRMGLIEGIKKTIIINDTYNSAPSSLSLALESFSKMKAKRKIVVLGDMLELGEEEKEFHRDIGRQVVTAGADFFVAVGENMGLAMSQFNVITRTKEKSAHFDNSVEAGRFLQSLMKPGDLVLIKGSRGMKMEKVVEEVKMR